MSGNAKQKTRSPNQTLVELRVNQGLSYREMSRLTGVSVPSISLAEKGHTPGPKIQFEIAELFKVRPTDIWPYERQKVHS